MSLVGCQTGMLCWRAIVLTTGSVSLWPRPFGWSGLVITATISKLASSRASRDAALKASVPKKMIRLVIPEVSIVSDVFVIIERLKLAFLVEPIKCIMLIANVVNKDYAVGVVDFVLNNSSQESIGT